jgi:beta-galactosidase
VQSAESTVSFAPMLFGFLLLLLFFLLLNLDRRFRDHAKRSLLRPFNFFADLRDRRTLPSSQTMMLSIILAGSIGLCVGPLLHDVYSLSNSNGALKAALPIGLRSWSLASDGSYFEMILWLTAIALAKIFSIVLILRFVAMFRKGRILIGDTFNVSVWSFLPFILVLPLDLILPRMDIEPSTVKLAGVLFVFVGLWVYYRLLKGIGVLFDVYPARLYMYGTAAIIIVGILIAGYLKSVHVLI